VKPSHTIRLTFDDPNVVSDAGVVPALRLGESAGLYDLLEEALTVDSPNATAKTTCVVGGMLADADSIDDLETRVEVNRGGPGNPLSDEELARKFHDNAVRSLPEERAAELAARTLALPDAQRVEDLTAADLGGGALRSRQLPLPDCVGQVGHPLRRLRADRLQGHAARVHALEQADSGAEQHG
jgi:hypothetical protein